MKIKITTGKYSGDYEASSSKEAIKAFFRDITNGDIHLDQLGVIGNWTDGTEPIPFRIAPALVKAGRLSMGDLKATMEANELFFEPQELTAIVKQDAWMVAL